MAEKTPRKPARKEKKPWQSPRVKTGQLFEGNSLACGKIPGQIDPDTGEEDLVCSQQDPITS